MSKEKCLSVLIFHVKKRVLCLLYMYLFLLYARVLKTGEYRSLVLMDIPRFQLGILYSVMIGSDELHCVGGKIIYGL